MSEPQPHTRPLVEVIEAAIAAANPYDLHPAFNAKIAQAVLDAIEAAGLVIVDSDALDHLISSASILQKNSEACVAKHHGHDIAALGAPGWLRDTAKDIDAIRAALAASPSLSAPCAVTPAAVRYRNRWDVVIEVEGVPA